MARVGISNAFLEFKAGAVSAGGILGIIFTRIVFALTRVDKMPLSLGVNPDKM